MRKKCTRRVLAMLLPLVLLLGGVGVYFGYQTYERTLYPLRYQEIVNRYAEQYDLPPSLLYAVIRTESHFQEDAVSRVGAKGLMQLMDTTYEWIQTKIPGEAEPLSRIFEPEINIRCGAKVLDVLHDLFSEPETAIAAYNAGNGTVSKWLKDERYSADGKTLKDIPYTETAHYVERVVEAQKRYQELYHIQ